MDAEYYAVIMAGGGGTRLWPYSRRTQPKQTLKLFGERTLFQLAVDRIQPIIPAERIIVVTVAEQAKILQEQVSAIPAENYLLEPAPRGTASVIAWAAVHLESRSPGCIMACLTADHVIKDEARFREVLLAAYDVAMEGDLVTLGITPRYADLGYGYIHQGQLRGEFRGFKVFRVEAFKEKPDQSLAEEYLESGKYAWNSGMFVWKTSSILMEVERQMPNLYLGIKEIDSASSTPEEKTVLEKVWLGLMSETIDYGIMENAETVTVIPADDLGWWDIGSWGRMFEIQELDENGNVILAPQVITLDTTGSLLFQSPEMEGSRLIAALGVEDLVIIDTKDVVFICKREQSERIKHMVESLKNSELESLL